MDLWAEYTLESISGLSFIGSFAMIFWLVWFECKLQKKRELARGLLLSLAISDWVFSISNLSYLDVDLENINPLRQGTFSRLGIFLLIDA